MIKIYNDRVVYNGFKKKKTKIDDSTLLMYCDEHVELDEKVTFERIMNLFGKNEQDINYFFYRPLGGYNVKLFINDMNQPLNNEDKENIKDYKNEYLEVYSHPDIWKYEKKEKRFDYQQCFDFHLVKKKEKIPYGISFCKLNTMKKHCVKINMEMDFIVNDTTKKMTKKTLTTAILKTKFECFRLYDFIWAILYEISWHGSPEQRDKVGEELINRVHSIKEGTEKLIPWEEVKANLKSKIKKKKPALRG